MDLESFFEELGLDGAPAEEEGTQTRPRCEGCRRPSTVCLCDHLPTSPLPTRGALVVRGVQDACGSTLVASAFAHSTDPTYQRHLRREGMFNVTTRGCHAGDLIGR